MSEKPMSESGSLKTAETEARIAEEARRQQQHRADKRADAEARGKGGKKPICEVQKNEELPDRTLEVRKKPLPNPSSHPKIQLPTLKTPRRDQPSRP